MIYAVSADFRYLSIPVLLRLVIDFFQHDFAM